MSFLRIIGPASIEVWISSPVRSRKPVLMKQMRFGGALDAGLEVDGGAPLLVHDADLHACSAGRPSIFSTRSKSSQVERDLVRAVHLRLDDIDRAGAAVLDLGVALEVVDREQAGDGGIEQAFRNFLALLVQHRVGEHVVADIAHQQQAAAVQLQLALPSGVL